jgi:hypothetical protein
MVCPCTSACILFAVYVSKYELHVVGDKRP